MKIIDRPQVFSVFPELIAAQSTRHGGISPPPFSTLNLGFSTADEKENIEENRKIFFSQLKIDKTQVATSAQVHGDKILIADTAQHAHGYDAIITKQKNIFPAVGIADCCPVLIYDAANKAVAAIHAGWRGTVLQIVSGTLKVMQKEFGTEGKNCFAYVGTCISECAFEVGTEVAEKFSEEFVSWDEKRQKHFVDLKSANKKQLLDFGIPGAQTEVSPACTITNNDRYFSYRLGKGNTGRMLAVIGVRG
jgi:polyphenol oxidase